MRIQHNIPGMRNTRIGKQLNGKMSKIMQKLSSGTRISVAADDAAGLSVSEKLRFMISTQSQGLQNVDEGVGVAQTADAALAEVNDMLRRAQQLCIQAENGTYSDEDLKSISNEVNALYDEIERIFDSTQCGDLKLFSPPGYNPIGDDSILREYTETVSAVTGLEAWGTMGEVQDKQFEMAQNAMQASVTMKLDSGVDVNDASTLNNKSFLLYPPSSSRPIRVTFTSDPNASDKSTGSSTTADGVSYYGYTIATKKYATVQDVLDHLCDLTKSTYPFSGKNLELDKANTRVNAATGEITFTFELGTLEQTINGSSYQTDNAAGAADNAIRIESTQDSSLLPIDGADNATSYSKVYQTAIDLLPGLSGALSSSDIATLTANSLYLTGGPTIRFTATGETGKINVSGLTAEQVRDAIINEINAYRNNNGEQVYSAKLTDGKVVLEYLKGPETSYDYEYISENKAYTATQTATPIDIIQTSTTPATGEAGEKYTITLPSDLTVDKLPLSLQIGSRVYVFYKSEADMTVSGVGNTYTRSVSSNVYESIASAIQSTYGSSEVSTKVNGSTITVTGKYAAKDMNFSVAEATGEIATSRSILLSGLKYLYPSAEISVDLSAAMSSESAVSDLIGKGFTLMNGSTATAFEFVCTPGAKTNPSAYEINVGGCTNYDKIAEAIQTVLKSKVTSSINITNSNGKLTISVPSASSSYTFIDGLTGSDGLFLDQAGTISQQASGGSNATQPQTTIDFSGYNSRNFDELYGKGFRITCATCEGEFINIMFCHDAANSGFPSEVVETDDGLRFTNYAVELKNMKNGSDIVNSIVTQLQGKLNHFTEVTAGEPSSVLKILDKRAGNIVTGGSTMRAEVLSGVYTNCTYTMSYTEYTNADAYIGAPDSNTTAFYGYCPIYLGGEGNDDQYILIHLPTLSLGLLNLDPPRPDFTDPASIRDVYDRLKIAEDVILTARGRLGADQNRLEHSRKALGVSVEQSTDSYSTIKDTDVAQAMAEQTKLSILTNLQQSMLSHVMDDASTILQLLKQ